MNNSESVILNALHDAAIILDQSGTIVVNNTAWDKNQGSLSLHSEKPNSENFFDQCSQAIEDGNDYALRLLLGTRDVLNQEKEHFRVTLANSYKGLLRWYKVEVSAIIFKSEHCALLVFHDISEEIKSVEMSREAEALNRLNFKLSGMGIILGKENGEILDVNPAACSILGYTKEELKEGGRSMIVDEEDPAHREVVRARNKESVFLGEKEYKGKNGSFIPVQLTSVKYQSRNNGQLIINTFRKIQHEKDNEYSLEVERRFTKTALNSISGIFFVLNPERKFVRWNNSMLDDLGYSDEEIVEMTVFDIFAPSESKNIQCFINDAFENGKMDFSGKIISKHSGIRHYHLQFNTFQNKDEVFLVVTGVDRTDFVKSEKLREQNYRLLTELFDNSPIATVMINPESKTEKVNKAFTDLFGFQEREILGRKVNSLITNKDVENEAEQISQHAFKGNSDQRTALRFKKDGTAIPVLLSTVPVRIEGQIIAVYGMYVDLTELVDLKNHLQKSLNEKEVLLQEVHHRVKNNLAIMASLLQLQILNDCNESAKPKLQEAYGRIFSIAKVHEALYNKDDIAEINFTDYLTSIVETMPNLAKAQNFHFDIQKIDTPLVLNVNQAIPLGLLINEIMNLTPASSQEDQLAQLNYRLEGESVHISIRGLEKQAKEYNADSKSSKFNHMLINTFLQQIEGKIEVDVNNKCRFNISFEKSNSIMGSGNSLINQRNGNLKTNVA